ncbi:hypothetical protein BASA61_007328 [Batrachochytrium salamandrivorans]|nr:hypothetical protein BASA61_007328 [Batrachochytrium salamandrivorans]
MMEANEFGGTRDVRLELELGGLWKLEHVLYICGTGGGAGHGSMTGGGGEPVWRYPVELLEHDLWGRRGMIIGAAGHARLADFLQVAYRQYHPHVKYHRDRLVEVGELTEIAPQRQPMADG